LDSAELWLLREGRRKEAGLGGQPPSERTLSDTLGRLSVCERFTCCKARRMEVRGHGKRREVENEGYWHRLIRQPAGSGVSIRLFCQERRRCRWRKSTAESERAVRWRDLHGVAVVGKGRDWESWD
jgi:hypothetical protein